MAGGVEEAEREKAVEVGPGGEAEGVVERELGERHEGGERRAERRLGEVGGFSAVAPWIG